MRYFSLSVLSLVFILSGCKRTVKHKKPNIIILLADDLGYGELGSYGQKVIKTPVLDSIATKGMRFTNFYAGAPVCAPSRAVLMTGISGSENSVRGNLGLENGKWVRVALDKKEMTIAEMIKKSGYSTGFVGKWHLGVPNDISTWACNRGFDFALQEQWGEDDSGYKFDEQLHWINAREDSLYYDEKKWQCKDEFRTNVALNYLDTLKKDKPFFLYMSYRAPHAHERYIHNKELYADKGWSETERMHAAKITLLDKQVGRMFQKLEEMGELENTLVIFTSDNGPHNEWGHDHKFFDSNGKLKGYKRDVYEGGTRVPMIAYWKGKIAEGKTTSHVACFNDIMPTIAEVAGVNIPNQTNGMSILPLLFGEKQQIHKSLNWEFQVVRKDAKGLRQSALMGKWKAVRYGANSSVELYDLNVDVEEKNNVASEHSEIVKQLERIMNKSRSENRYFPYGDKQ